MEDISSTDSEMAAIEETVATSDQLVKVHVGCGEKVRQGLRSRSGGPGHGLTNF